MMNRIYDIGLDEEKAKHSNIFNDPDIPEQAKRKCELRIKPFKTASEWKELLEISSSLGGVKNPWNEAWEELQHQMLAIDPKDMFGSHYNLLDEINYWIGARSYPPPELLLSFADAYKCYLLHGGEISLEEALIGKPIQNGGNHAKRSAIASRDSRIYWFYLTKIIPDEQNSATKYSIETAAVDYLNANPDVNLDVETVKRIIKRQNAKRRNRNKI